MSRRPLPTDEWFDDLAEGVVLVEAGRVANLNTAAAELLGVTRERAFGQPLITVLRDHRIERVLEEGRRQELTVRGRRLDVVPIRGGLALRDVDQERSRSEQERDLLAVLSHELRTPMTTVRATLEALEYDDLPATDRASLVRRAVSEADRVVRLLDDLTVQVAPPRERSVPLLEVTDRVLALLAPVLRERAVQVREELPDLLVWVDPDKLTQVLLNLLSNAAVHGPADSEVLLSASEDRGWARVTVVDHGRSLPPERFASLFAPHVRGAGATGRGTGLGLYIVRSIVERWGGRVWGRPLHGPDGTETGAELGNEFGFLVPLGRDALPVP